MKESLLKRRTRMYTRQRRTHSAFMARTRPCTGTLPRETDGQTEILCLDKAATDCMLGART